MMMMSCHNPFYTISVSNAVFILVGCGYPPGNVIYEIGMHVERLCLQSST